MKQRDEKIPIFEKPTKHRDLTRNFDKNKSIFKGWQLDNPKTYEACIEHDMQFWKIARFTKPLEDLVNIENIFRKHAGALKNIYI